MTIDSKQTKISDTSLISEVERNRAELTVLSDIIAVSDREAVIQRIRDVYGEAGVNIPAVQVVVALEQQEAKRNAQYEITSDFSNKLKQAKRNVRLGIVATASSAVGGAAYGVIHFFFG